jgi:hypothetical protein
MRLLSILPVELEVIFNSDCGHGRHLREPATLLLTITVSTNSLHAAATSPSPTAAALDNPGPEGGGARPGDLPTEGNAPMGPVPDGQTEMSRTLGRAEEAIEAMDTMKAWKSAISVIKQVMDNVDPIAEV